MLHVNDLQTTFISKKESVTAVDGVSLRIPKGKVVGLVGESGSGKSVTAYSIMGLLPAHAKRTGEILWKGQDLTTLSDKKLQSIRGKEIALILQNPLAALNPVFTVGNQLVETIMLHHQVSKEEATARAIELLKRVQIPDPEKRFYQYPHEFSLGMCQRVMIALTVSMMPELLIADEPTASLDVTVQAQIMLLLKEIQAQDNMSILFISHDLGLIAQNCDYVYIMYLGHIVEEGAPSAIFHNPQHPYTQALIHAIPDPNPDNKMETLPIQGDIPSPMNIPKGCRFHTRCPKALDRCKTDVPIMQKKGDSISACWLE
ncbi:ABC transporter ATP-binding protein [bacterium]|nr:ABC transporter ATP-binding protein [bacterium]